MSDTLMISVSGMRGHVGTDLTPELVARHAAAFGAWVREAGSDDGRKPAVVIGRDSRTSGPMFERAAASGLMSVGVDVIELGVVPTPTVQMAVEYHHAGGGLILTASHNPIEWNALKFVGPDGIFLDADSGARVRALVEQGPVRMGWKGLGEVRQDHEAVSRHLDAILALSMIDVTAIRKRRFHVGLDCVRGAGVTAIVPLLERLECRVSGINLEPDGRFPRAPEPIPENLGELGALVRDSGASIGLAVDPDVDRLALVDETGQPIGEDYTLAFAIRAVLGASGTFTGGPVVVNLSTSLVVEDAATSGRGQIATRAGGRSQRGQSNSGRAGRDRRRGKWRYHVSRATHRSRCTPGCGLDLASPCHVWTNGIATCCSGASVHHRKSEGSSRSGAAADVRSAETAIPGCGAG